MIKRYKNQQAIVTFIMAVVRGLGASAFLGILGWLVVYYASIETRFTADAAGIVANQEQINHNYAEIRDGLRDIRDTVHEINNRTRNFPHKGSADDIGP